MSLILPFTQFWLPEPETCFHAGSVEIMQSNGSLHLTAHLEQPSAETRATAHQQRLWELGDVLELFIKKTEDEDYYEYQIAPNGMMLALHYSDPIAVVAVRNGERKIEEFLSDVPIQGNASLIPTGWSASLTVPMSGERFRFHCGRYDYSSDSTPVVSSTASLTKRDFHCVEDWQQMVFS
jgi:hypothetical protein